MTSITVRYFSKSGHTKKIAGAIAKAADCDAKAIPAPVEKPVDILFLGSSVYWAGVSSEVKDYIKSLDKTKIGKVVVFSTSGLAERAYPQIWKCLQEKGIPVDKENFYCRGAFAALHRGHPDENDLKNAAAFTKKVLGAY